MQNISCKTKFDLHENQPARGTHFQMNGFRRNTRFDKEARGISETPYWHELIESLGNVDENASLKRKISNNKK